VRDKNKQKKLVSGNGRDYHKYITPYHF